MIISQSGASLFSLVSSLFLSQCQRIVFSRFFPTSLFSPPLLTRIDFFFSPVRLALHFSVAVVLYSSPPPFTPPALFLFMISSHFTDCSNISPSLTSNKQLHYSEREREWRRAADLPLPITELLRPSPRPDWSEEPPVRLYWGADDCACRRAAVRHPLHLNHHRLGRARSQSLHPFLLLTHVTLRRVNTSVCINQ